jgi:hypothetical protein
VKATVGKHKRQRDAEHRALVRRGVKQCKRTGRARSGRAKRGAARVGAACRGMTGAGLVLCVGRAHAARRGRGERSAWPE